jgi:hypothetical protein
MTHSELQSIAFDGSLWFNYSAEILQYADLMSGIITDDENCIIDGNVYYYYDLISPLFEIFGALQLDYPNNLTTEQKSVLSQLYDYREQYNYKYGHQCSINRDDLYEDTENDNYCNLRHIYELLGGSAPITEDDNE